MLTSTLTWLKSMHSSMFTASLIIIYLCRYGVSGFPTLKFFPKGNKAGEDYDGGRDLDDFVKFINEKCGTSRDPKGHLTSEVGYKAKRNRFGIKLMNSGFDAFCSFVVV